MQESEVFQSNFCRKFGECMRSSCRLQEVKIGKMFNIFGTKMFRNVIEIHFNAIKYHD